MEYFDFPQGSREWFDARLGKFSASTAWKFMERTQKGLPTAEFNNQKWAIIEERLTGVPKTIMINDAMRWGTEQEPNCRAFYSELIEQEIIEVGLAKHAQHDFIVCSPDGLIDVDGLFEAKCPTTKTYLEVMLTNVPPVNYVWQCQFQMWVTDRFYTDLVFFDPRLPPQLQSTVFHLERDEEKIAQLEQTILAVEEDINRTIDAIYERAQ
jgi:putative phage-type endonuclease